MKKEFLPLESKPCWIITWLIRIFTPVFLLVGTVLFLIFPLLLTTNEIAFSIIAIVYYPTLIYLGYRLFLHSKKNARERVVKILVDDKGLHYYKVNGTTEEILYSQLQAWNLTDVYDVGVSQKIKTWFLKVRYADDVVEVDFHKIDPGFTYYAGNKRALRSKFLQGITYFRPDLRIDPFIFEAFYINPENFKFNTKYFVKSITETLAVMLVLGAALALFMLWLVK